MASHLEERKHQMRIKEPPKEPTEKRIYSHAMWAEAFYGKPVTEWLEIALLDLARTTTMDLCWDTSNIGLEDVHMTRSDGYGDEPEIHLNIHETEEALLARHNQWEKDFSEWEEWIALNREAIEEEEERRRQAFNARGDKEVRALKQQAFKLQRKIKELENNRKDS